MLQHLVKKTMFESFENIVRVLIYNAAIIFFMGALITLVLQTGGFYQLPLVLFVICTTFSGSLLLVSFKGKDKLKKTFINSLILALINGIFIFASLSSFIFYLNKNNLILGTLMFWITLAWLTIVLLVMAILIEDSCSLKDAFRLAGRVSLVHGKDVLIFLIYFCSFFIFTPLLIFGGGTSVILLKNFYNIIMLKDKYMVEHPSEKLDWNEILKDEVEKINQKSLKSIFFPWK